MHSARHSRSRRYGTTRYQQRDLYDVTGILISDHLAEKTVNHHSLDHPLRHLEESRAPVQCQGAGLALRQPIHTYHKRLP